jgi:hypothetical protein
MLEDCGVDGWVDGGEPVVAFKVLQMGPADHIEKVLENGARRATEVLRCVTGGGESQALELDAHAGEMFPKPRAQGIDGQSLQLLERTNFFLAP